MRKNKVRSLYWVELGDMKAINTTSFGRSNTKQCLKSTVHVSALSFLHNSKGYVFECEHRIYMDETYIVFGVDVTVVLLLCTQIYQIPFETTGYCQSHFHASNITKVAVNLDDIVASLDMNRHVNHAQSNSNICGSTGCTSILHTIAVRHETIFYFPQRISQY